MAAIVTKSTRRESDRVKADEKAESWVGKSPIQRQVVNPKRKPKRETRVEQGRENENRRTDEIDRQADKTGRGQRKGMEMEMGMGDGGNGCK